MKLKAYNIYVFTLAILLASVNSFSQTVYAYNGADSGSGKMLVVSANRSGKNGAGDHVKLYSKTYTISDNDKLRIENEFGTVAIKTWDKNEFKVDVVITVSANQKDDKRIFDDISVTDSRQGQTVLFKTNMGRPSNTAGKKISINYVVHMPSKNALDIENPFGAVSIPDFDGKVYVNSSYATLTAGNLTNNANQIKVSYGTVSIESVKTCKLFMEYGAVSIGTAENLTASFDNGTAQIGKLLVSGNISSSYAGTLSIDEFGKEFKKLSVTAEYSTLQLGFGRNQDANFDVTIENGRFNYGKNANITSKTPPDSRSGWSPTQNYKGHLGKGDAAKTISINSNYGNVTFN